MLAMQYEVAFAAGHDMNKVRRRAAERGPLFDRYPGLVQKASMINASMINEGQAEVLGDRVGNAYAAFYLWEDDAAVRAFLESEAFANVGETYGRPRVRLWQALSFKRTGGLKPCLAVQETIPVPPDERLGEVRRLEERAGNGWLNSRGFQSQVVGLDPYRWELVRFSLWSDPRAAALPTGGETRTFEVLHLSAPVPEPDLQGYAAGLRPLETPVRPARFA